MKTTLKNWSSPSKSFLAPSTPLKKLPDIFLMTSPHDSQTTTDVKLEMIPVSKPEMKFHMIYIIYTAWPMHAQTEKMSFSCKDD